MADHGHLLGEVAQLVRSKNAGPFWMTIDVFFATDADYQRAAAPGLLTEDVIAGLYRVAAAGVALYRLPNIRVIKASFPRPVVQGSFADRDMHSGQQHIPLTSAWGLRSGTGHRATRVKRPTIREQEAWSCQ